MNIAPKCPSGSAKSIWGTIKKLQIGQVETPGVMVQRKKSLLLMRILQIASVSAICWNLAVLQAVSWFTAQVR